MANGSRCCGLPWFLVKACCADGCTAVRDEEFRVSGSIVFGVPLCIFGIGLFIPFLWANPFKETADGHCSNPVVVDMAAAMPALLVLLSGCFIGTSLCPKNMNFFAVTSIVLIGVFGTSILAIAILVLQGACTGDSRVFVLSVALIGLLLPSTICVSCKLRSCCRELLSADTTPMAPPAQHEMVQTVLPGKHSKPQRVPTPNIAQRLLAQALMFGDENLVEMLLDANGQAGNPIWRLYRCLHLACCFCQCRCSRYNPQIEDAPDLEGAAAPRKFSRASLTFVHEEDFGNLPIHYLASGATGDHVFSGPDEAHHQDSKRWSSVRRSLVPTLTDKSRARLLLRMHSKGCLQADMLMQSNRAGALPLHFAASTGSTAVAEALVETLGPSEAYASLSTIDQGGHTPCELALLHGHMDCARVLLGEQSTWQGLSRLSHQRTRLEACLEGVFARLTSSLPSDALFRAGTAVHVQNGEDAMLCRLAEQISEVQLRTSSQLPYSVAEAFLRHHRFVVDAAVHAYAEDSRVALDAAGLQSVELPIACGIEEATMIGVSEAVDVAHRSRCIVCFDDIDPMITFPQACRWLSCDHRTCNACLRMHLEVRLGEGDIAGFVCPSPGCKLLIPQELSRELLGCDQLTKLQALKAREFVDIDRACTWCPRPRCGCAVAVLGIEDEFGQTVQCQCGTRFCFTCKEPDGHEPSTCEQLRLWKASLEGFKEQMGQASEQWVAKHAQRCPGCQAGIERKSGCNHMVCSGCGKHFCYMCGRDWAEHLSQQGGVDFYNCRLKPSATSTAAEARSYAESQRLQEFEACLAGWTANARDAQFQGSVVGALEHLADIFSLPGFKENISQISTTCLHARKVLQCCYVLHFNVEGSQLLLGMQHHIGELEAMASALEVASGLRAVEVSMTERKSLNGHWLEAADARAPDTPLHMLNLKELLPQLFVAELAIETLMQLETALQLQPVQLASSFRQEMRNPQNQSIWQGLRNQIERHTHVSDSCTVM